MIPKAESRAYFRALGKRITERRKEIGMTQAELSRALGVSQQTVFAYELGDRRVNVLILTKMAPIFQVSVEELMGITKAVQIPKRWLSPRAMRHAERLQALSKTQQRFLVRILDLLEAGTVRWSANQHAGKVG